MPRPDGVREVTNTGSGFEVSVTTDVDDEGFLARECPSCEAPFKMLEHEYALLPEEIALTCPYCGHCEHHAEFLTPGQRERVLAAAAALAQQMVHREMNRMLRKTFGPSRRPRRSRGSFISLDVSYKPGRPPRLVALPEAFGDKTRSTVECSSCGNHHAVYSISAFCPVCGPRPAADKVLEEIGAARLALALEDRFTDEDERENLRAAGVFERFAVDALGSVVSLFEITARAAFAKRAADHATLTKGKGNVFQRLDDTAALFSEHAGLDLVDLAGEERWLRMKQSFARRHVHVHNGGVVDEKFLAQSPGLGLKPGQRIVIRRAEAQTALDDLEAIVRAFA